MFQQRPMPPMNTRGFFPQQNQFTMGRQPFQGAFRGPIMGGGQFGPQMPVRGGGGLKGLLSRIIPGSQGAGAAMNPQGIIQGATGASRATGALQNLANPANISGMLGNVQKVLGMAQQVTPMVQQYGPLVKNLPAMLKIYRELKNGDSGDESTASDETLVTSPEVATEESETEEQLDIKKPKQQKRKKQEQIEKPVDSDSKAKKNTSKVQKKRSKSPKRSTPKMYI